MITVVPMTGRGVRFQEANYADWKPLVKVRGKSIIDWTLRSLPEGDPTWLVVPPDKLADVHDHEFERQVRILVSERAGKGPADTMLDLREHLDPTKPILVANCDQYVVWDHTEPSRLFALPEPYVDGVIATFDHPSDRWSYVQHKQGQQPWYVNEVRAKSSFGVKAVVGIYCYRTVQILWNAVIKGLATMEYAAPNGELFMCPLYNYLATTMSVPVARMYPLGEPQDVLNFEALPYVE